MRKLLVCLALFLSACSVKPVNERSVSWDTLHYSSQIAAEPAGFIRMGK